MYTSVGTIHYSKNDHVGFKLFVSVDFNLAAYYRHLIPKYIDVQPQMYKPHISVVRKEIPNNIEHWGKYEGEKVNFEYENIVRFGTVYCWLNCFCVQLEKIRAELGLSISSQYTQPPEGFQKCFHITLGNFKHKIYGRNKVGSFSHNNCKLQTTLVDGD